MTRPAPPEPEWVTTAELCRRLSISRSTIYRHRLTRFAIPVGRDWRFKIEDVIRHYEQQLDRHGDDE